MTDRPAPGLDGVVAAEACVMFHQSHGQQCCITCLALNVKLYTADRYCSDNRKVTDLNA